MNKIGFQNFRQFQNFAPLDYRGITFLVGRNNSGKSTLVKALLLIDNYFKSGNFDTFSFGTNVLEDANIVTYGRAKNLQTKENFINFTQKIENYLIELTVSGEDDKAFANVQTLTLSDLELKLKFVFKMQSHLLQIIKEREDYNKVGLFIPFQYLQKQIDETKLLLEEPGLKKTSKEYIELVSTLEKLNSKLDDIKLKDAKLAEVDSETFFTIEYEFGGMRSLEEIVRNCVNEASLQYKKDYNNIQKGEGYSENFENLYALESYDPVMVKSSLSHLMTLMDDYSVAYMGANPAKQSALFAIREKNNALAQAIHEFKQLNISIGEEEYRFVLKWMEEFEVGNGFIITMHAGEAYEMKIRSNNTEIHLADKGMGSIQAMLLIMRIACVIRRVNLAVGTYDLYSVIEENEVKKYAYNYRIIDKTTVIIEEPELNLHPALQSKLADLFLDVHKRFKIDFLIETHSEYILRRSQVIVAINEFEVAPNENPFCVHYFPKDIQQMPYKLEYQEDGSFNRNFGDGFFDEASSSTLELLKLKRQKKA